jgi:sulfonate transport system substrate-binding protein
MTQHGTSWPARRFLGVVMTASVVLAACSTPAATTAPTTAPTASSAAGSSQEPAGSPDAAAILADLKSKLTGQSLKVGSSASPNASVIGFFKTLQYLEEDFGVQVEEQLLDSDPLVAAMVSGQVQIGQLSLAGVASANANGGTFMAIGVNDQKNLFVVAGKKPTATLEELRGKTFGATQNLAQITGQTARACLASANIDIEKDVVLTRFNNTGEVTSAIRSGQIVAGISAIFRLTKINLEDAGAINILCYGTEANPSISSVWVTERAWAEANPDMALALIVSELKAARWAKADKAGWIALAKEVIEDYSDEVGELDYQQIVIEQDNWPVNGGLDKGLCDSTLAVSLASGAITEAVACEDIADFSFQERALEIVGEQ